jgi:hypothetical protein
MFLGEGLGLFGLHQDFGDRSGQPFILEAVPPGDFSRAGNQAAQSGDGAWFTLTVFFAKARACHRDKSGTTRRRRRGGPTPWSPRPDPAMCEENR